VETIGTPQAEASLKTMPSFAVSIFLPSGWEARLPHASGSIQFRGAVPQEMYTVVNASTFANAWNFAVKACSHWISETLGYFLAIRARHVKLSIPFLGMSPTQRM